MAGRITMAQYREARDEAIGDYAVGVAEATFAKGEKAAAEKASAQHFIVLGAVWTNAPASRLSDPEKIRADVFEDVEAAKTRTKDQILIQYDVMEARGETPALSRSDARRNSTKGIRARRPVFQDLLETISVDPQVARDAFDGKHTWKQIAGILHQSRRDRALAVRQEVPVGIDHLGSPNWLGPNVHKTHVVETRELADGTVEEYCTHSRGPKGKTEDVEVVISQMAAGDLLAETLDDIAAEQVRQQARNRIVRACEDAVILPQFTIPESANAKSDEN